MAWHYYDSANPVAGDPAAAQHGDFIIDGSNSDLSNESIGPTYLFNGFTADYYWGQSASIPRNRINTDPAFRRNEIFALGVNADLDWAVNNYSWNDPVGNTLWIKGGEYYEIQLWYGMHGTFGNPVKVVNYDGQVRVYRPFMFPGAIDVKISGRYDPVNGYGDTNYKGFDDYTGGQLSGRFGFWVDNRWTGRGDANILVIGDAENYAGTHIRQTKGVEIEYVEVSNGGFDAFVVKDNTPVDPWEPITDVNIHHNYIHDMRSEASYVGWGDVNGDAGYDKPMKYQEIVRFKFNNNVVARCGGEAFQMTPIRDGEIMNNTVINSGANFLDPFLKAQNGLIQINALGTLKFQNNIAIGGLSSSIGPALVRDIYDDATIIPSSDIRYNASFPNSTYKDAYNRFNQALTYETQQLPVFPEGYTSLQLLFENNYFGADFGMGRFYLAQGYSVDDVHDFVFRNNFLHAFGAYQLPNIWGTAYPATRDLAGWFSFAAGNQWNILLDGNKYKGNNNFPSTAGRVTSVNNQIDNSIVQPQFRWSDLPQGYDFGKIKHYAWKHFEDAFFRNVTVSGRDITTWFIPNYGNEWNNGSDLPKFITYNTDEIVCAQIVGEGTRYYRAKSDGISNLHPWDDDGTYWELLPQFTDDLFLVEDSFYDQLGMGVQPLGTIVTPPTPTITTSKRGRKTLL